MKKISLLLTVATALFAATANFLTITDASAQDLYVGNTTPNNTISLTAGTNIYSNTYVGFQSSASNNLLSIENSGSVLTNSGELFVGADGSGNIMTISNGGTVDNGWSSYGGGGVVGLNGNSSNNSVLVTGANSLWNNSWDNIVGVAGVANSMVISNGATVAAGGGGYIGFTNTASNNSVMITGSNSTWSIATSGTSGGFYVGFFGSGSSLVISNGGAVSDGIGYIGNYAGSTNNSVLVTGVGSIWSNSGTSYIYEGSVYVGYRGSGTLTVANSGNVVTTALNLGYYSGSSGTLNIGSFGGSDKAGTIASQTIIFGSGGGSIDLNQKDTFQLTSSISGYGIVNQLGAGTTILGNISAANTYTGGTTVSRGTLLAIGPNSEVSALGTGNLTINSGGTVVVGSDNALGWNNGATTTINTGGVLTITSTNVQNLNAVAISGGTISSPAHLGTNPAAWGSFIFQGTINAGGSSNTSVISALDMALLENGGTIFNVAGGSTNGIDLLVSGSFTSPTNQPPSTGLITTGRGTMEMTGSNSYTGTTIISAGTLLANNTAGSVFGSSTVTVQSGATIGGNGTIGGLTTIANGGNLVPGLGSSGVLNFTAGLTLQSESMTTFSIGGSNIFTSIDLGTNALTYGGALVFDLTNSYSGTAGDTFDLFGSSLASPSGSPFSVDLKGNVVGDLISNGSGDWAYTNDGLRYNFNQTNGTLSVATVVPEPSSCALFGLGALVMAVVARRRVR